MSSVNDDVIPTETVDPEVAAAVTSSRTVAVVDEVLTEDRTGPSFGALRKVIEFSDHVPAPTESALTVPDRWWSVRESTSTADCTRPRSAVGTANRRYAAFGSPWYLPARSVGSAP